MSKVWFVTGSSRGLGRNFVEAALARGDKVAATARDAATLDDLVATYGDAVLPLTMDVTDTDAVSQSVKQATERFGRIDVVVNNAGHGLFGAVEELTERQVRLELETNLFGALRVIQAVLPSMREQGSGHIIQMSSISSLVAMPIAGAYCASKWAVEALNESLAEEVAGFGIKVTIVEPGAFATRRAGEKPNPLADGDQTVVNPVYDGVRQSLAGFAKNMQSGDPKTAAQAMLKIVDADEPPRRIFLGPQGFPLVQQAYADRLKTWADWQDLSLEAHGSLEPANG